MNTSTEVVTIASLMNMESGAEIILSMMSEDQLIALKQRIRSALGELMIVESLSELHGNLVALLPLVQIALVHRVINDPVTVGEWKGLEDEPS